MRKSMSPSNKMKSRSDFPVSSPFLTTFEGEVVSSVREPFYTSGNNMSVVNLSGDNSHIDKFINEGEPSVGNPWHEDNLMRSLVNGTLDFTQVS